jgi:hypothetical protein
MDPRAPAHPVGSANGFYHGIHLGISVGSHPLHKNMPALRAGTVFYGTSLVVATLVVQYSPTGTQFARQTTWSSPGNPVLNPRLTSADEG